MHPIIVNEVAAELSSKMLIILFMNQITIGNFKVISNPKLEVPVDIEILILRNRKEIIFKSIVVPGQQDHDWMFQGLLFDRLNPPAVITGSNGQSISKLGESIPFTLNEEKAKLAEDIMIWAIKQIKEIADAKK